MPLPAAALPATESRSPTPDHRAPPRTTPGSARSLLLTLLGEYVIRSDTPVWTSTLLAAMGGVGIGEKAARQAIARAAASGWIEGDRSGRRAAWRLAERGRALIVEGSRRVRGLRDDAAWDGRWLVLHVTLPEAQRALRLRLYRALAWAGFGNPTPGLWICPYAGRATEARAIVERFGLQDMAHVFVAQTLRFGIDERELVARAWNLAQIAGHYRELLDAFQRQRPRSPAAMLVAHIELVNALQRLPGVDPGLPDALLPARWAPRRAAAKLIELRARWAAPAHAAWDAIASGAALQDLAVVVRKQGAQP